MTPLVLFRYFAAAADCKSGDLLGIIPPWYKYLEFDKDCGVSLYKTGTTEFDLAKFWLLGFGVIEILLRVAGLVAVGYVIYGGFLFTTSQGDPEKRKNAQNTIINALIGVSISVLGSVLVSFIAGKF